MLLKEIRSLKRFTDVLTTLTKYGFDELVHHLETPGAEYLRKIHPVDEELSVYERIRLALEDLGPTWVKFGQIMSLRPDLLPEEMLFELAKLQDEAPTIAIEEISKIIEEQTGNTVKDLFSVFDVDPIAAASLSQVHKGVLREENYFVAVKVKRPGIEKSIEADLDLLDAMCGFLDEKVENLKPYGLPDLAEVVRTNLVKELDFNLERQNMRVARSYAKESSVYIPKTYDKYCSDKVLFMEYIQGTRFKELENLSDFDREFIAKQGLKAAVKQILEDGYFHADPHPGNLLIKDDMDLCLIDWGLVGRLTEKDRFLLIELLKAVVDKDSDALVDTFLRLSNNKNRVPDPRAMERDFLELLDNYAAISLKEMNFGQFLMQMTNLIRKQKMKVPVDFVVMIKALVTAEGSARQAYPDLNIVEEVGGYVEDLAVRRYKPGVIWKNLRNSFASMWFAQREFPRQVQQIIEKLERSELGFTFKIEKLDDLLLTFERASSRLTVGIITGAIIIGSSMIVTTGVGPFLFGYPALGVVGYIISVILGLWLVVTILRN